MKPWLPAMRRYMVVNRDRMYFNPLHRIVTRQQKNAMVWAVDSNAQPMALMRAARWYGKRYKDKRFS